MENPIFKYVNTLLGSEENNHLGCRQKVGQIMYRGPTFCPHPHSLRHSIGLAESGNTADSFHTSSAISAT